MKYIIEIDKDKVFTDGQNNWLYRAKGFNSLVFDETGLSKLEPAQEAWEKDLKEVQKATEDVEYNRGFEDGKNEAIYNTELIPELKKCNYSLGYDKALEDVDHAIEVIKSMTFKECAEWFKDCVGLDNVICGFTIPRIIEITKSYEEKKKAEEELKVGDEVIITGLKDEKTTGVITMLANNNMAVICLINGSEMARVTKNDVTPTGKHYDIESILKELGE